MLQIEGGGNSEAPTTLIPEDYQIVRSERVAGLNIRPSHYSTHLAEGKRSLEVKLGIDNVTVRTGKTVKSSLTLQQNQPVIFHRAR